MTASATGTVSAKKNCRAAGLMVPTGKKIGKHASLQAPW